MPVPFSQIAKIDPDLLLDLGTFDPILDCDTRLFIDPHLVKHSDIAEFVDSYKNLHSYFGKIGKLLAASDSIGDVFWNKADEMMRWHEVKGLCVGYSSKGTSGSGIGPKLRLQLLTTAKQIIDKGKNDPELFELVGMFQTDFGADRIGDMTANILRPDLEAYSARIVEELKVNISECFDVDDVTGLPINPFNNTVIYLVPMALLRDLPVALDWSNRDRISAENEQLRIQVNTLIGYSWREATHTSTKEIIKDCILDNPELFDDLVNIYRDKDAQFYDYKSDRSGEYSWFPSAKKITKENPLHLHLSSTPTIDEVESLVLKICRKFRSLIEDNGWSKLLYDSDGKIKSEQAAQLLFYGIADSYCEANGVMIARESDSGRGPVDFKFGNNMGNSVLVEVKKSTNTSGLRKGIEKQLPQYMRSEKSKRAIYLVLDVGYTKAALKTLDGISKSISGAAIKIFHIDGSIKPSASKL